MSSTSTLFNEGKTYLALVKVEAASEQDAEQLVTGALSYAQASGNLPATFDVLCAVRDGGLSDEDLSDAIESAVEDATADDDED